MKTSVGLQSVVQNQRSAYTSPDISVAAGRYRVEIKYRNKVTTDVHVAILDGGSIIHKEELDHDGTVYVEFTVPTATSTLQIELFHNGGISGAGSLDISLADVTLEQINYSMTVQSTADYYPFGMKLPTSVNSSFGERHDYQSEFSEKDPETGWNAFQLRMYDARIGRWLSTDPANQFASPYRTGNNPISGTDPTGGREDWYEDSQGNIVWDDNVTSQASLDAAGIDGTYLGRNVIVATHNRDGVNEPINTAKFELYLETNTFGPSATIYGNTVPANTNTSGTLAEGLYSAASGSRSKYVAKGIEDLAILINGGEAVPTVNGNPNSSDNMLRGIFLHMGNNYQESLFDSKGNAYSRGCLTTGCYSGSRDAHNEFMNTVGTDFNGTLYLRPKPQISYIPFSNDLQNIHFTTW